MSSVVCRVRVDGPLAPFAAGIEEALAAEGYLEESALPLLRLLSELSGWLTERSLGAADLTGEVIDRFFANGGGRRPSRSPPPFVVARRGHLSQEERR